jgi:hypothetical protein
MFSDRRSKNEILTPPASDDICVMKTEHLIYNFFGGVGVYRQASLHVR